MTCRAARVDSCRHAAATYALQQNNRLLDNVHASMLDLNQFYLTRSRCVDFCQCGAEARRGPPSSEESRAIMHGRPRQPKGLPEDPEKAKASQKRVVIKGIPSHSVTKADTV